MVGTKAMSHPEAIRLLTQCRAMLLEIEGMLVEEPKVDPKEQEITGPAQSTKMAVDDPNHWPMVKTTPLFQRIQAKTGRPIKDRDTWLIWAGMLKTYGKAELEAVLTEAPGQWPDHYLKMLAARKKNSVSAY